MSAGCHREERAALRLERDQLETKLRATLTERDAARAEVARLTGEQAEADARVSGLEAEVARLEATARHVFATAVDIETNALAAESDELDTGAAAAFRAVTEGFAGDRLAGIASKRAAALDARIRQRADARQKARREIRQLIEACRSDSRRARRAEEEGIRFVGLFQQLDLNSAMAAGHRRQALEASAQRAKERGEALLSKADDQDGALRSDLEDCLNDR
jgi:chromosome segregation ATPase